jgi:arylsulfatase A-like enzyme
MIGRLLEFLEEQDILDDTVVIVVADHGENLGEHGLMSHQYSVHNTLVHVPLIIRYPPIFRGGQRVSELVQSLEIFTTILDILNIDRAEVPNDVRGRSLAPQKVAAQPLPFAVSEYLVPNLARMKRLFGEHDLSRFDRSLRAIRQNGYKAIFGSDSQDELYDVSVDPAEKVNLAARAPELLADLRVQLDEWLASITLAETAEPGRAAAELDERIVARLRELGYF